MRTVILLSGMLISNAIKTVDYSGLEVKFVGTILTICMVMDFIDFVRGME